MNPTLRSFLTFMFWFTLVATLMLLLMFLGLECRGASVVTEQFLDRVAWLESRNNPKAVGRAGELSAYQLLPRAVQDVNKTVGWRHGFEAATRDHARGYAREYLRICESRIERILGRQPTTQETYEAYRLGPTGFLRARTKLRNTRLDRSATGCSLGLQSTAAGSALRTTSPQ